MWGGAAAQASEQNQTGFFQGLGLGGPLSELEESCADINVKVNNRVGSLRAAFPALGQRSVEGAEAGTHSS